MVNNAFVQRKSSSPTSKALIHAARRLGIEISKLTFAPPVALVYNPLHYAWEPHCNYLDKFAFGSKRVVFLGMNPGPFGMAQTGVPFGEVAAVRDWLLVEGTVTKPLQEHPQRPITGFACHRSEISGQRLWSLFATRFHRPANFFQEHIVINYCPLSFLEKTGRNRTPDKLPPNEKSALFALCDEHLRTVVETLKPEWLIGIGGFAAARAESVFENGNVKLGRITHPSPANPAANQNWGSIVTKQLEALGVWSPKTQK
jgi:single-strand selective monofunctional uracil DNA glycosylase